MDTGCQPEVSGCPNPKSLPLLAFNNQKSSTGPQENKLRGETIFGTGEVFISFKLSELKKKKKSKKAEVKISQEPAAVDSSALGPSVTQKKLCYNLGQESHPSLCLQSSERMVPHIGVPERLLRGKNCVSLEKLCEGKIL